VTIADVAPLTVDTTRADFTDLCRRVHPRLVGALVLRSGDRALAEDLAQEALARAWRDWSSLRDPATRDAWVFSTAFNLLRSWHRRLGVARRRSADIAREDEDRGTGDVAVSVDVRGAVAALPERQREAIALRYYADLSVRDAAVVMRCAEGTVRALTAQAVAALRPALGSIIDDIDLDDIDEGSRR
jgi:RNA polymerase sigma factor (sigma-70 family)